MMIPILADTSWLRDNAHAEQFITCLLLLFAATLFTLFKDEEVRHKWCSLMLALLVIYLGYILVAVIAGCSLYEVLGWESSLRRDPKRMLIFLIWLGSGYVLSRKMLYLFYRWRDRRGKDDNDTDTTY